MMLPGTKNRSPRLTATKPGFSVFIPTLLIILTLTLAPRILAQNPGQPEPADLDPGPKFKLRPAAPTIPPVAPALPALPQPPAVAAPALPAIPALPSLPALPAVPGPMIAALPPAAVKAVPAPQPQGKPASLEERLARVERILESLVSGKKMKYDDFSPKRAETKWELQQPGQWKEGKDLIDRKEIERIKEMAKREAARATEEVKRATREVEKARADQLRQSRGQTKQDSQKQMEALRRQLEQIERQKEAVGRQLERLERQLEQLEEQGGADAPDALQPEDDNDRIQNEPRSKEPANR